MVEQLFIEVARKKKSLLPVSLSFLPDDILDATLCPVIIPFHAQLYAKVLRFALCKGVLLGNNILTHLFTMRRGSGFWDYFITAGVKVHAPGLRRLPKSSGLGRVLQGHCTSGDPRVPVQPLPARQRLARGTPRRSHSKRSAHLKRKRGRTSPAGLQNETRKSHRDAVISRFQANHLTERGALPCPRRRGRVQRNNQPEPNR